MSEINRWNILLNTSNATLDYPAVSPGPASTSNCIFNLTNPPIVLTNPNNWFEISIVNCCIPFSFKFIHTDAPANNTIPGCIMTVNGTPATFTITLPTGNFDISALTSLYQKALQAQYLIMEPAGLSVFSVIYQLAQGVVIFSVVLGVGDTGVSCFIPFSTNADFLGSMLGFQLDTTFSDTVPQTGNFHFNVSPFQSLFIRSTKLIGQNYEFLNESQGNQQNSTILATLSLFTGFDTYLNANNLIPMKTKLLAKVIDQIDIFLTGDYNLIPLNLYGVPMFLSLLITEISSGPNANYISLHNQIKNPGSLPLVPKRPLQNTVGGQEIEQDVSEDAGPEMPSEGSVPEAPLEEGEVPQISDENRQKALDEIEHLKMALEPQQT